MMSLHRRAHMKMRAYYHASLIFILPTWPPLRSTLFPYTTLFRSFQEFFPNNLDVAAGHHVGTIEFFSRFLPGDRKSTRLNSSHQIISYAVFCLKKKT